MSLEQAVRGWVGGLLLAAASTVGAQDFPTRNLTIVVPFAAGGPFEIIRPLAQSMERGLGRPVLVENRPGAGGIVGSDAVAKSAPDGHTIVFGSAALTAFKVLVKSVPFEPLRDLAPVSLYVELPGGIVTNGNVPAKTVEEFVAHAKANPGKLNFASIGPNTTLLLLSAFLRSAGLQLTEIPYAGTSNAQTALLRNDVQLMNATMNLALKAHVDAGNIRPLLITTQRRSRIFPDVPTLAEKGFNIPNNGWAGLLVASGTPRPIVNRLSAEVARYVASPEAQKAAFDSGVDLVSSTPEQMRQIMEAHAKIWAETAAAINLQPQ